MANNFYNKFCMIFHIVGGITLRRRLEKYSVRFLNSGESLLTVNQSAFSQRLPSFFHVIHHFLEGASLLREAVCM